MKTDFPFGLTLKDVERDYGKYWGFGTDFFEVGFKKEFGRYPENTVEYNNYVEYLKLKDPENFKKCYNLNNIDYMHQGEYNRNLDGSVNIEKEYWDSEIKLRGTVDYGTGLKW